MPQLSYTLNEWLALRRYSRAEWYRMKDKPRVIGVGRAQRIPSEEDAIWLKRQIAAIDSKASESKRKKLSRIAAKNVRGREEAHAG